MTVAFILAAVVVYALVAGFIWSLCAELDQADRTID